MLFELNPNVYSGWPTLLEARSDLVTITERIAVTCDVTIQGGHQARVVAAGQFIHAYFERVHSGPAMQV